MMPSQDIVVDRREPKPAALSETIVIDWAPQSAEALDAIALPAAAAKPEPARRPLLMLVASPRRLSGIGPAASDRRY